MSDDITPPHWGTTCSECVQLSECAYGFGAQPGDPVCTGFREPLRVTSPVACDAPETGHAMKGTEHDEG